VLEESFVYCEVGLYKLHPADPQLGSARFQPLNPPLDPS
jgi:hypothetical protein